METILMSIHPKWCEKIFNGEKTIEVRKTAPKPPFKVVVYCTKSMTHLYRYDKCIDENEQLFTVDYNKHSLMTSNEFNGKVIGEFICDKVDKISVHNDTVYSVNNLFADKLKNMCLTVAELKEYLGAKNNGYAIGITATKLYDKPRELGEFRVIRERSYYAIPYDVSSYQKISRHEPITRPPQSWQYVEEVKE